MENNLTPEQKQAAAQQVIKKSNHGWLIFFLWLVAAGWMIYLVSSALSTPEVNPPSPVATNQSQTSSPTSERQPLAPKQQSSIAQLIGLGASSTYQPFKIEGTIKSFEQGQLVILTDGSNNKALIMVNEKEMDNLDLMTGDTISVEGVYLGAFGDISAVSDPSSYPSETILSLPSNTPVLTSDKLEVITSSATSQAGTWVEVANDRLESITGPNQIKDSPPFQVTTQRWRVVWTMTFNSKIPSDGSAGFTYNSSTETLWMKRVKSLTDTSNPVQFDLLTVPFTNGQTVGGTYEGFGAGNFLIAISVGSYDDVIWSYKIEELQ